MNICHGIKINMLSIFIRNVTDIERYFVNKSIIIKQFLRRKKTSKNVMFLFDIEIFYFRYEIMETIDNYVPFCVTSNKIRNSTEICLVIGNSKFINQKGKVCLNYRVFFFYEAFSRMKISSFFHLISFIEIFSLPSTVNHILYKKLFIIFSKAKQIIREH